jgi:hypothetical protein
MANAQLTGKLLEAFAAANNQLAHLFPIDFS